jgi:5-methylcytosine-specific restriction endonuclease McrA
MTYIAASLRKLVIERADSRCEYCHLPEKYAYYSHEVDHIYAEKHGGETKDENLCLACAVCNRHKSSDICSIDPVTNAIVALFHPRKDKWDEHFAIHGSGHIQPLSPEARVTERILGFNRPDLVSDRQRLLRQGIYR